MFDTNYLKTNEIGVSEFVDSKNRLHIVKHSVIITNFDRKELEERIAEDLYKIFTADKC